MAYSTGQIIRVMRRIIEEHEHMDQMAVGAMVLRGLSSKTKNMMRMLIRAAECGDLEPYELVAGLDKHYTCWRITADHMAWLE
jgi:hypothetical protein